MDKTVFGNSYYFLIDGTIFGKLMDYYLKICITTRNGLFVGLPLFNIGVIIARHQSKIITTSNKKIFLYERLWRAMINANCVKEYSEIASYNRKKYCIKIMKIVRNKINGIRICSRYHKIT